MAVFWHLATALLLLPAALLAQTPCFYPNGSPVTAEPVSPCNTTSTDAAVCCPLNWTCLSNLLCAKPDEGLLGRYSCTDRQWSSPACPGFCTKSKRHCMTDPLLSRLGVRPVADVEVDLSSGGNQAVLQCADGRFCCDDNRSANCCAIATADFFTLPAATPVETITSAHLPAPSKSTSAADQSSGTDNPNASLTATNQTATNQTATQSLGPHPTSHLDPQAAPEHRPHNWNGMHDNLSGGQKVGLVMGVVVGILGGMLFMCLCHFFWRRYRKRRDSSLRGSYPPSLRHFKPSGNAWRWPWTRSRRRPDAEELATREAPLNPSELPANALSVVPGRVEIAGQDDIRVHESQTPVAAHVAPANIPPSPLSPVSNTSSERTRHGSYHALTKNMGSPGHSSIGQDDASSAEHAVHAIGSRGQLVSHSSRQSMRPLEESTVDQNGELGNGEREAVDKPVSQTSDYSAKENGEEEKAFELPD